MPETSQKPEILFSESVITHLSESSESRKRVIQNITYILEYFSDWDNTIRDHTSKSENLIDWVHRSCMKLWLLFEKKYPPLSDIFPERAIYQSVFSVPIGGHMDPVSLGLRSKIFAIYLETDLEQKWEYLRKSHGRTLKTETYEYINRRFPGGIDVSPGAQQALEQPEESVFFDTDTYPVGFTSKQ